MAATDTKTLAERAKAFLASHGGDAEKAIAKLLTENFKYRQTIRDGAGAGGDSPYKADETLRRENEELSRENERLAALVPAVGAVVLTGDDAVVWPKYKALNLAPEKITEAVKDLGELKTKVATHERESVIARAAEDLGLKASVLTKVVGAEGLHLEFRDVATKGDDGKTVTKSVPHVRDAKDDKAAFKPLADALESELADFAPSLRADGAARPDADAADTGVEYVEQKKGGGPLNPGPSHDKLVENARATGEFAFI